MWVTELKSQSTITSVSQQQSEHIEDLDSFLHHQRKKLKVNKDTSILRERRNDILVQLFTLTKRHQLRKKWDLENKIKKIDELIEKRESGREEAEFENIIKPYLETIQSINNHSEDSVNDSDSRRSSRSRSRGIKRPMTAAPVGKGRPLKQTKYFSGEVDRRAYERESVRNELLGELEAAPPPVYMVRGDMCDKCNIPMIILASEALLGCPQCSRTRLYIQATSSRIAYGEEVEFASFSYKRQTHFQEWIVAFQAKETTEVPESVLNQVMDLLYTNKKIKHVSKINQKKVKEALKELRLRKYYERAPQITSRITGILPPRMTPFQEEQCKLMFAAIQVPFNIHCPPERTNFLSYGYCLYKFCELLGYDQFLPCFTLLKGKEKLATMDKIYRKITRELDWEYISSC